MTSNGTHAVVDPSADTAAHDDAPRGPQRRCIASGEVRDKADLLRFVVGPDGVIFPDPGEKLPGRGIWCLPRRDMIERAHRRRQFARAARAKVTVPDDLAAQAADILRRQCRDRLGLARRSGEVIAGFEKVRAALTSQRVALLLEARDGAADGRMKITRLARARTPGLPIFTAFDAAEQGAAIGRDETVHLAILEGGHAESLRRDCARLMGLTGDETDTEERGTESAGAK